MPLAGSLPARVALQSNYIQAETGYTKQVRGEDYAQ
jgi:hypothetical protein